MMNDSHPITSNHVLTALAILGRPAASLYPPTDRHLPLLLGALLNVVESDIADQLDAGGGGRPDPDLAARVLDGFLALSAADIDQAHPLALAALRLDRTAGELHRRMEQLPPPGRQVLDFAGQASRCAAIAVTAHLLAADGRGYRPTRDDLQRELVALEAAVTDVIKRFNDIVAQLRHDQRST
jgi:hypothetical protein